MDRLPIQPDAEPPSETGALGFGESAVEGIDATISDLQGLPSSEEPEQSTQPEPAPAPTRPVGFQAELPQLAAQIDAASQAAHLSAPAASPPPKRPKGRLIIGSFLMGILLAGFYIVWDGVFRYQSYGIVDANRLPIRAAEPGVIQRVYVAEGDRVRTGDLLLVMDSTELQRRLAQTQDDLALGEAQLDALMAELQQSLEHGARAHEADAEDFSAEYFELASKLRAHRAELERLNRNLARAIDLKQKNVISEEQYEDIHFAQTGEKELVEMLEEAVEHLRRRTRLAKPELEITIDQIRPALVRIDNYKRELLRIRDDIARKQIVSPLSGIVVKRQCLTSRWVETSEVLMEIVEEGSSQPVIYLSQHDTLQLEPGQDINIHILPHHKPLECTVERVGAEYVPVPLSIERFYGKNESVLPVFLKSKYLVELPPGATIRVPHSMSELDPNLAAGNKSTPSEEESGFKLSSENLGKRKETPPERISFNILDNIRHD